MSSNIFRSFLNSKALAYLIAIPFFICLVSCGETEKKVPLSDTDLQIIENHKTDSLNDNKSKELIDKYNAVSEWDSVRLYSFETEELFKDKSKFFAVEGRVQDISKKDSGYLVKIHGRGNRIIELELTKMQLPLILNSHDIHKRQRGIFIFIATKTTTAYPQLSSDTDGEGEDVSSYILYNFEHTLTTIRGKLIDCYISKNIE